LITTEQSKKYWAIEKGLQCAIRSARGPANCPKRLQVSMLTKVAGIERLGGLRLRVRFSDGSEGIHDFVSLVNESGAALAPLRDEAYFARVFLEFGAPTWPNGFDIEPEWLRREMETAGELKRVAAE
jgi:hypothetical protein